MEIIDKHYLSLQFWLRIYQTNASAFQGFFEDIMQKAFPDFQKIRPYGRKGDRGNDGYRPDLGIYYQAYSPIRPQEKEAEAARKLKRDFETLKANWDKISTIRTFNFVFNDKGMGVSIEIETALAELQIANQDIKFKKFIAKDLEDIFFNLKPDQILALGFDVDSTNALRIVSESLARLEADLDRDNGAFVLRVLETHKDIISGLQSEPLLLEYEILECRAFVQLEMVREAKQQYESLCKRYPNDPRPFLYLAQVHLDNEDVEMNDELLKQAETLDANHWLLRLETLIRQYRLGNQIDAASIDEQSFPAVSRIRSNFYRLYALFLERAGDEARAESFIERAIHLNPDKINNYHAKLSILESRCFNQPVDNETLRKRAEKLLREIEAVRQITGAWGKLSPRNQVILNLKKLNVAAVQENLPEMEKLGEESIDLIMQCHFDQTIDQMLVGFLRFGELSPEDFKRLLHHLQGAEKGISDDLARNIAFQFILKNNLFTEGRQFFDAAKKKGILGFIDNLKTSKYDEVCLFLKQDLHFAVNMAIIPTNPPDLRRKIIENLPNDGSVQKDKLLFLLNYEQKNINEAFDLLRGFDLSKLNYFECRPILDIAREKKAWEVVTKVLETLLHREKDRQVILHLKLELCAANLDLGRFPEAIQLGERISSDEQEMSLLNQQRKEDLLRNTLVARMKRGEYLQAKTLLEKHPGLNNTFEFKVAIEGEIYIRNNEVDKAIASVVAGMKSLKTPTPEQYGGLILFFVQIDSLIDFPLTLQEKVDTDCFVKFRDQERWYFIGDKDELDATRISSTDEKYSDLLNKKIGDKVIFDERYRSSTIEHTIENILPIEKYICWQCIHHAQQLSVEHRWKKMEMIEVPTTGVGIDTRYVEARLLDEERKHGDFFDFYCRENVPLAFLAIDQGGLTRAIAKIVNENKGFVKLSSGDITERDQQKNVAERVIEGEPFYIDGTSALVLSEPGMLEQIHEYLPRLKVPQSVINFLFKSKEKFMYTPGQMGHMGYAQGKVTYSSIDHNLRAVIQKNFETSIKALESRPENISVISSGNKAECFSEQRVPVEICDACILAQRDNMAVLTEDFLYLQANQMETKKKAPEYCSSFALVRVLYEQRKVTFEQYLNFFTYLSSYRSRFLFLNADDIEKAVFGDGVIKMVQPERIRQFNFPLTLSEVYGVPFNMAFQVVESFLIRVLTDDAVLPAIVERIFTEVLTGFPSDKDKRALGKMFLRESVQIVNYPAAELRGIKNQNIIALVAGTLYSDV